MDTEKKRSLIINVMYYAIFAGLAFVLLKYALPLLAPFVIAAVIAYILSYPTRFLSEKFRIPYKIVAILMVLIFYCIVGSLIALLTVKMFSWIVDLVSTMPSLYEQFILPIVTSLFTKVEEVFLRMDASLLSVLEQMESSLISTVGGMVSSFSGKAMSTLSGIASSLPGLFIQLVLLIISTFFITIDYQKLTGFIFDQLNDKTKNLVVQIKNYVVGTLFVCIRSYILIMSITCVELCIGLSILKLDHALLIAVAISIFDILPVLGTGGIMIPWAVIALVLGHVELGIGLLLVYVAITVIRNIIEPKIVGGQLGLHPVVTLASMFAGVQLFGVVGLFGFPIVLSLLRHLNDNGNIHIFKTGTEKTE